MSRFLHRAALACAAVAVSVVPLASPASASATIQHIATVSGSVTACASDVLIYDKTGSTLNVQNVSDFTVFASGVPVATSGPVVDGALAPVLTARAPSTNLMPGWYTTRSLLNPALGTGTLTINAC